MKPEDSAAIAAPSRRAVRHLADPLADLVFPISSRFLHEFVRVPSGSRLDLVRISLESRSDLVGSGTSQELAGRHPRRSIPGRGMTPEKKVKSHQCPRAAAAPRTSLVQRATQGRREQRTRRRRVTVPQRGARQTGSPPRPADDPVAPAVIRSRAFTWADAQDWELEHQSTSSRKWCA